jgi:hypothetical protein
MDLHDLHGRQGPYDGTRMTLPRIIHVYCGVVLTSSVLKRTLGFGGTQETPRISLLLF